MQSPDINLNYSLSYKSLEFSYVNSSPWSSFYFDKSSYNLSYTVTKENNKFALLINDTPKTGYLLSFKWSSNYRYGSYSVDYLQKGDKPLLNLTINHKF